MRLVIASGNAHKVAEIGEMLATAAVDLEVVGQKDLGEPPEIAETADSFAGNAVLKARGIAGWLDQEGETGSDLVLADDSGICIDAFDGGPGVHSARFAGSNATDEDNNARMVGDLEAQGLDRSAAHYVCVFALARVDGGPLRVPTLDGVHPVEDTLCIEGRCHGYVRTIRRGEGGFGYDPYFWVDEDARTFAELSREDKAERSHRGAATRILVGVLQKLLG
jgi:XTP/dITP diphosphohydrolase